MELHQLIEKIKTEQNCEVFPALENIDLPSRTPDDLRQFYRLCNGMQLFKDSDYAIEIVGVDLFIPINRYLYPLESIDWNVDTGEVSNHWYLIAKDAMQSQYISLDLTLERYGQCYDSFIETHSLIGDSPIIACNFTELLQQIYTGKGLYWYWLQDNFKSLGDAYDLPVL